MDATDTFLCFQIVPGKHGRRFKLFLRNIKQQFFPFQRLQYKVELCVLFAHFPKGQTHIPK